jgi:hypothetical protein
MPSLPASSTVSGLEHATKAGGWGCCTGLGRIAVGGMRKCVPSQSKMSERHIRGIIENASCHCESSSARSISNASCSTRDELLPEPQSTRP